MTVPQLLANCAARNGRLVSQMEIMVPFSASYALVVSRGIGSIQTLLKVLETEKAPPNDPAWETVIIQIQELLSAIGLFCSHLNLESTADQCQRIKGRIFERTNPEPIEAAEIINLITDLRQRFEDELSRIDFGFIPKAKAPYYLGYSFGREFDKKFPELRREVEDAARSYSHDLYTASVFHLMRVMEVGVQYFGRQLGVKLTTTPTGNQSIRELTWKEILDGIRGKIKGPYKTTKAKRRSEERQALVSHLEAVKEAWRNPTMHPRASYDESECLNILNHVKAFMSDLSVH